MGVEVSGLSRRLGAAAHFDECRLAHFRGPEGGDCEMKAGLFGILVMLLVTVATADSKGESLQYSRFGHIDLYRRSTVPSTVALFVSGDGGWNKGVVDMAGALSSLDALVVGIDITHYLRELERSNEKCLYPASDFELLSKFVQKSLGFPDYKQPVLVGYSSGAALVYAMLAQAPPNTFLGGISLGFCPDLALTKPPCQGSGLEWRPAPGATGYSFLPAKDLSAPWIALQGTLDEVCDPDKTKAYVNQVRNGEVVMLPKVGHGFSVQRHWMPQFKETFTRLTAKNNGGRSPTNGAMEDLPLVEVPAKGPGPDILAVIISGDGGWAGIDRELAHGLSDHGVPVVGLDSLKYFWTPRTPDGAARDLKRILEHYFSSWNRPQAVLIGYSLGADVLPFMVNRLPKELLDRVRLVALLSPSPSVSFEFHLTEWLGEPSGKDALPVLPEVEKLRRRKILCFQGKRERGSLCGEMDARLAKEVVLSGAHHFGGKYDVITETILKELP
jgi:type IV secretory pathway VirJ component